MNTLNRVLAVISIGLLTSCGNSDSGGGSGIPGSGGSSGSTGGGANGGFVGTGGTSVGGSGGVVVGATGGTSSNGGTGNVVGMDGVHPGTGGTISTGGTPGGTGGTITSTGGTSPGTGGSPSCTNTQTDPNNCGTCGHVCAGTCTAGKCDPAFGGCFQRASFDTCDAFCASIGQRCAAGSCRGSTTWISWGSGGGTLCALAVSQSTQGSDACSATLPGSMYDLFNCCCQ